MLGDAQGIRRSVATVLEQLSRTQEDNANFATLLAEFIWVTNRSKFVDKKKNAAFKKTIPADY